MAAKNEKLMEYVRRAEYKRRLDAHEVWGHVGGRIYTLVKIFYTIAFVLATVVNLGYLIFWCARYFTERERLADPGSARNAILLVGLMTALLIAAYVLLVMRRPFGYLVCTVLPSVLLSLHFWNEMQDILLTQGFAPYVFRHMLWYLLMSLTALALFAMQLRENAYFRRQYAKLEAKLYGKASAETGPAGVLTDADWERLLEAYGQSKPEKSAREVQPDETD